ncbi:MAG: type II toxin-antitoxin system HicA family toxin [Planctomycetaceae bacterium]|nr:MAG: type II toxin-antitoxin system HicA family toxin [Planctomycetaceae bacterium]
MAVLLRRYGYEVTRQTGSHMRLTTTQVGEHHVTIPRHGSLRVGTLSAVLSDVVEHLGISRQALVETLFGK